MMATFQRLSLRGGPFASAQGRLRPDVAISLPKGEIASSPSLRSDILAMTSRLAYGLQLTAYGFHSGEPHDF